MCFRRKVGREVVWLVGSGVVVLASVDIVEFNGVGRWTRPPCNT